MGKHILMGDNDFKDYICGIWADSDGSIHVCHADSSGARRCSSVEFNPFLWTSGAAECSYAHVFAQSAPPEGGPRAPLDAVMRFSSPADMEKYFKGRDKRLPVERISSVENQYLLANSLRMFSGLKFGEIRRVQLDIEVHSVEGFPQASRPSDRIIAVGISGFGGGKILEISEMTDSAEKKLLADLQREILSRDPDLIEGHNIFKFDLPYIAERSKRMGVPMDWGRFGAGVQFRKSRLKIAEYAVRYSRKNSRRHSYSSSALRYNCKGNAVVHAKGVCNPLRHKHPPVAHIYWRGRNKRRIRFRPEAVSRISFGRFARDCSSCGQSSSDLRRASPKFSAYAAGVHIARFGNEG